MYTNISLHTNVDTERRGHHILKTGTLCTNFYIHRSSVEQSRNLLVALRCGCLFNNWTTPLSCRKTVSSKISLRTCGDVSSLLSLVRMLSKSTPNWCAPNRLKTKKKEDNNSNCSYWVKYNISNNTYLQK